MKTIVALLLLAVVASASLSPLLAIAVGWLGLIVAVMAGINAVRGRLERQASVLGVEEQVATIYERSGRLVLRRRAP